MIAMNSYAKVVEMFAIFADNGSHLYEDEFIKLVVSVDDSKHTCIAVLNKTDNIIYLDKGTSFVYYNGTPVSLFSNSSHTESQGNMTGGSVNAGSVANALGIGGRVGALLNGLNLGGAATSQSSTTFYEQRVIMLAPHAIYTLYSWEEEQLWESIYNRLGKTIRPRKAGRNWTYEEYTSPIVLQALLTYSTKEDFSESLKASVSNYISVVAMGKKKQGISSLPYHIYSADKSYLQDRNGIPIGWAYILPSTLIVGTIIASSLE